MNFKQAKKDFYTLVDRQVHDLCATSSVRVKYGDGKIGPSAGTLNKLTTGLTAYLKYFNRPVFECKDKANCICCVMQAFDSCNAPSFVNQALMRFGGTHQKIVEKHFLDCLTIPSDLKGIDRIKSKVKQNLWFVIVCEIENPVFDGQTKTKLTTPLDWPSMFSKTTVKNCMEKLNMWQVIRDKYTLKKKVSSQKSKTNLNIPKLDDAQSE